MKENEKLLAFWINKDVAEKFKKFCKENDLSVAQMLRKLITEKMEVVK